MVLTADQHTGPERPLLMSVVDDLPALLTPAEVTGHVTYPQFPVMATIQQPSWKLLLVLSKTTSFSVLKFILCFASQLSSGMGE